MADGGESSQELMVEGKVAGLSVIRQLPGVEGEGGPGLLLEYYSNVCI